MTEKLPDGYDENDDYGYGELSILHGIIPKETHKFLNYSNKKTFDILSPGWIKNMKKNQKNGLWEKHGSFISGCRGLAKEKAVIAIGAGPSFNKNKTTLKFVYDMDTQSGRTFEDRDFLFFCSNHQFRPCLEMGIVPDFVFLVDSSDVVFNQMCVDIPPIAKDCVLIVPFQASPRVLKNWSNAEREMLFFVPHTEKMRNAFTDITGVDSENHWIVAGGNVLNTMWMFGTKVFHSKVFMCVGNDLSFPIKKTKKAQENGYYADGDYSSNAPGTGTGRDEANTEKRWVSFGIRKRRVHIPNKSDLEIYSDDVVGTNYSLYVYKTWIEETMILMTGLKKELGLHYYNCSEGGILGVMAKSLDEDKRKEDGNWYMLDEICPRWHTTTLENATNQFKQARRMSQWQDGLIQPAARYASG